MLTAALLLSILGVIDAEREPRRTAESRTPKGYIWGGTHAFAAGGLGFGVASTIRCYGLFCGEGERWSDPYAALYGRAGGLWASDRAAVELAAEVGFSGLLASPNAARDENGARGPSMAFAGAVAALVRIGDGAYWPFRARLGVLALNTARCSFGCGRHDAVALVGFDLLGLGYVSSRGLQIELTLPSIRYTGNAFASRGHNRLAYPIVLTVGQIF